MANLIKINRYHPAKYYNSSEEAVMRAALAVHRKA